MSAPALRFKEFCTSWQPIKLGEIAEITSSKRVYLSDYVSEGIPFYRGKEISELKRNEIPKDILYITRDSYESFKANFGVPQINDILITAVGTLGNIYRVQSNAEFYFKDGNLIWLKGINISPAFLEILLERNHVAIQKSSIGSSQRALTIVELKKLTFDAPSLPEQTKIANFLTAVDEKLAQLTRKHDLLTQYKKGVMQQIFSQELRFKDDDGREFGEWEVHELGDLCSTFKSGAGITSEKISEQGEYPVFGGNGLRGYTDSYTHDGFYVLIGRQGALCGNINRSIGKAYISEHAIAVCTNENADNQWLAYRLDYMQLNRLSESSAQPGLSVNKIVKIKLEAPSKAEQTKIANFLTAIDDKITATQTQLAAVKHYKQGLLQQMFV